MREKVVQKPIEVQRTYGQINLVAVRIPSQVSDESEMSQNPCFLFLPTVKISTTYSFPIRAVSHPGRIYLLIFKPGLSRYRKKKKREGKRNGVIHVRHRQINLLMIKIKNQNCSAKVLPNNRMQTTFQTNFTQMTRDLK